MQDFIALNIDNHNYSISICQKTANDADSIKILIPVYILSKKGYEIFRVCIESLKRNTQENHEIWTISLILRQKTMSRANTGGTPM